MSALSAAAVAVGFCNLIRWVKLALRTLTKREQLVQTFSALKNEARCWR